VTPEQIAGIFHARPAGLDHWRAKCPAHQGKTLTSLGIARGEDGRTLIKCWGGCAVNDICAAAGIKISDLFADSRTAGTEVRNRAREFEEWRSTCQGILTDRLRHLSQKAELAKIFLRTDPNCEVLWSALANFYHEEAELVAALDQLSFEKLSSWLETPVTRETLTAAFNEACQRSEEETNAA